MIAGLREMLFRLGCLLLYFALENDATSTTNDSCALGGRTYSVGVTWVPFLEPLGLNHCIRCTCVQNFGMNCYSIKCSKFHCQNKVEVPPECCARCTDLHASSEFQTPGEVPCQHNGSTYQHGDVFFNSELYPSREANQCGQCSCSEGNVYCRLVTCPDLLCASPQTVSDSCCQVCRDGSYESLTDNPQLTRGVRHSLHQCSEDTEESDPLGLVDPPTVALPEPVRPKGGSGTTVRIILEDNHRRACVYQRKTYSHGEVWHPTVHLFPLVSCVLCTCVDGNPECQKIICPTTFPCEKPERLDGKCCKVCPENKARLTDEIDIRKCGVSIYMFVPLSSNTQRPKEILKKIAVEREFSEDVEIYIWKLVRGVFHLMQINTIKKQQFRQEMRNFRLLSKRNKAYWNMLLVRGPEVRATESPDSEAKNF